MTLFEMNQGQTVEITGYSASNAVYLTEFGWCVE